MFCSSIVKPADWPRPRIAPGTSANTCASRRPRNARRGALDDRFGAVLAALALVERREVQIGLARVLAGRSAAAAAGDREEGVDVLLLRPVQEIMLRPARSDILRAARGRAGGKAELDHRIALVLGRE